MHKLFDFIIELIGWMRIAASPFLIGVLIGACVYFFYPNATTLIIASVLVLLGLIIGFYWATKVWKSKQGTMNYLYRNNHQDE